MQENLRTILSQQLIQASKRLMPDPPVFVQHRLVYPLAKLTTLILKNQCNICSLKTSSPLLVMVLEGEKTFGSDANAVTLQAGEILFVPPHFSCEVFNQPSSTGICSALLLEFSPDLLARIRQAYPTLIQSIVQDVKPKTVGGIHLQVALSVQLADALVYLVNSLARDSKDNITLNEHHLMEVALLLLRSNVQRFMLQALYPDFVTQVRHLIRSNPAADWSLRRLAQMLDVSISTLKRRLQAANLSYRQILDEERMNQAIELLNHSELSIAQIAIACGYRSQSRFAARFRLYHGCSPSEIRAQP